MTKAADASESNVASTTLLVDDEVRNRRVIHPTIDTTRDILGEARRRASTARTSPSTKTLTARRTT